MSKNRIVSSVTSFDHSVSPLLRLAMSFHQDFGLMNQSPDEAFNEFQKILSLEECAELKKEIGELLVRYPGKNQKGLKNAWFKIGASWHGKEFDLRESMTTWVKKLQ